MAATLRAGYALLALRMQEAADLSAGDIRTRLSDAIQDQHRGTGKWGYYIDHFGDAESGDVIYSCDGDTMRASYSIVDTPGAAACTIDFAGAEDVVPRTVYEPEADEDDHYAAMEESFRAQKLYSDVPIFERFVSKKDRDAASADDFAGKGKSYPILKPEDVMAAVHAMGRAGSGNLGPTGIRSRIIAIAKRKGWEKYLPKAWQADGGAETKESSAEQSAGAAAGSLSLCESAETTEIIALREARADYPIKLIAPGKGSSAFYPAEVLKRDGPTVFKSGTHVYLNHPTRAEEAARPEGDVANLAGVLTTAAEYQEAGAKGPGLYARMKVFADHAQMVEEKAAHVGMSIRASGEAVRESTGRVKMQDGLPILDKLVSAESVDVVTRAGAGGMILTEAARAANSQQENNDMAGISLEEAQKLVADAVASATRPLIDTNRKQAAREEAAAVLANVSLPVQAKQRITERATATVPVTAEGALDVTKLRETLVAEAKAEGEYLAAVTGSGRVVGMGSGFTAHIDAKEVERRKQMAAEEKSVGIETFRRLGLSESAAQAAFDGRAS